MQKIIELQLENFKIQFSYNENGLLKPNSFHNLESILIHKNTKFNEFIKEVEKKYIHLKIGSPTKEEKDEKDEKEEKRKKKKQDLEKNKPIFKSPFTKEIQYEDEDECKKFNDTIKHIEPFADGQYGTIRNWSYNVVVKIESCSNIIADIKWKKKILIFS